MFNAAKNSEFFAAEYTIVWRDKVVVDPMYGCKNLKLKGILAGRIDSTVRKRGVAWYGRTVSRRAEVLYSWALWSRQLVGCSVDCFPRILPV